MRDYSIMLNEEDIEFILWKEFKRRGHKFIDVDVFQVCTDSGKMEIYAEIRVVEDGGDGSRGNQSVD